jgi:2-polyprenyl-6-methoxyphenol hydroxylase-like FAD-dependent oxidoreductase
VARRAVGKRDVDVVVVGAGPVGLALALGLGVHGVSCLVLERADALSRHSRAPGIHQRTREVLRQWGAEDAFLDAGDLLTHIDLHDHRSEPVLSLDFAALRSEARDPGLLLLEQSRTEALLLDAATRTGAAEVRFGSEVVGIDEEPGGVVVTMRRDGRDRAVRAEFVVGCDGAGSFVRTALALPFEGFTYQARPMLADVEVDDARGDLPWPRWNNGRHGLTLAARLPSGPWRIIRLERGDGPEHVPRSEIDERVAEVLDARPVDVVWASRFDIHRRATPTLRVSRCLLAGDAGHIHSPVGGQGMNAGIQDAHNLAWKLAATLDGGDAEALLDSYDVERRTVVAGTVFRSTDLATRALLRSPPFAREAGVVLARSALRVEGLHRRALRRLAMLDHRYRPSSPLLDGGRAAGRRLPDVPLTGPDRRMHRLHDLLRHGTSLLDVGNDHPPPAAVPARSVVRIAPGGPDAYDDVTGGLGGIVGHRGRGWVLVRPDHHIAWVRAGTDELASGVRPAVGHEPW